MKRKIHALLLALLLVFSAALTAGAAGYSGSCRPGYRFWQQICTRDPGLCQPPASCTPSQPEAPEQPSVRVDRPASFTSPSPGRQDHSKCPLSLPSPEATQTWGQPPRLPGRAVQQHPEGSPTATVQPSRFPQSCTDSLSI